MMRAIRILHFRESLIVKLAILSGMRSGEIFGLKWGQVAGRQIVVRQRIYRGLVDTSKTRRSDRKIHLQSGVAADLASLQSTAKRDEANVWIFPSARPSPPSRNNLWH